MHTHILASFTRKSILVGRAHSSVQEPKLTVSGAIGSGLAIFTKLPHLYAQAVPYSLSGTPQQAFAGDFYAKKAAGYVVIDHPLLGEVEVWNTHVSGQHSEPTTKLTLDACCRRART